MKERVLVAVSGGPDSMYLLNSLLEKYDPIVMFVNYGLREASNHEEELVENYCEHNNLTLHKKRVLKEDWDSVPFKNKQAQYRYIRYEFFRKVAKKEDINIVYVGHHLDDWIETAIMQEERSPNFMYYGIRDLSNYKELIIKRPLLKKYKKDLIIFNQKNSIPFSIDETNQLEIFKRNQIRASLLARDNATKKMIVKNFKKLNRSNSLLRRTTQKNFYKWKEVNYDLDFWNGQNEKIQKSLIYLYLIYSHEFIKINDNKLNGVIEFLSSKNNKIKTYRVKENIFLKVNKEGELELIVKKETQNEKSK